MPDRREYPDRPVVGVGGVVISDGRVLLVRRGHPPLEGEWSIPGGMLELGETVIDGVQRELAEETGVEARVLEFIEVFERISFDDARQPKYHFVVLDYLCERVGGGTRAGSDASEVAWVAEAELAHYSVAPAATRVIEKAFAMKRQREAGRTP
jgi:8-oxo-dGTP diphosphatase